MAPYAFNDASSDHDDEGAPESFSLVQSKKAVRAQDDALMKFEAAEKEKKKQRNREKDRKLKERAQNSNRKGKAFAEEEALQARLASYRVGGGVEEFAAVEAGSDDEDSSYRGESEDKDAEMSQDDDEEERQTHVTRSSSKSTKSNPKYLPDHIFASAFTSQVSKPSGSSTKLDLKEKTTTSKNPRKKRSKSGTAKDLIVGTRVVRSLASNTRPEVSAAKGTKPPRKITTFIDRSLSLKGNRSKAKGWERKPANIGILKRNGPAIGFVRKQ